MRHSSLLPKAALASALLLGCSDQPGGTDPNPDATPPLMAEISRVETPLVIDYAVEEFTALVGVSLEHFPALCAGAEPEAVAETMIVTHPSSHGGTSAKVQTKGTEVPALVWTGTFGPDRNVCDLTGQQPFVGSVKVTINDNEGDFWETAPGGERHLHPIRGHGDRHRDRTALPTPRGAPTRNHARWHVYVPAGAFPQPDTHRRVNKGSGPQRDRWGQ